MAAVTPAVIGAGLGWAATHPGTMAIINQAAGWILGILSPASMIGLTRSQPRKGSVTTIKLHLGTGTSSGDNGFGGDLPDVQTYDRDGRALTDVSKAKGGKLDGGNFYQYDLMPTKWDHGYMTPNSEPEYLSLRHYGADPVCVAAISILYPDGWETNVVGDIMYKMCNWPGYDSPATIHIQGELHQPSCFWMGGHQKWGLPNHVWIHLPDFVAHESIIEQYVNDTDMICRSAPRLHQLSGVEDDFYPLVFSPYMTYPKNNDSESGATVFDRDTVLECSNWRWRDGKGAYGERMLPVSGKERHFPHPDSKASSSTWSVRRSEQEAQNDFNGVGNADVPSFFSLFSDSWTHSNQSNPSAIQACQSTNVMGPDMANSLERKYCHMETRKLFPYCETAEEFDCFDFDIGYVRPAPDNIMLLGVSAFNATASSAKRVRHDFGDIFFPRVDHTVSEPAWDPIPEVTTRAASASLELAGYTTLQTVATRLATALIGA